MDETQPQRGPRDIETAPKDGTPIIGGWSVSQGTIRYGKLWWTDNVYDSDPGTPWTGGWVNGDVEIGMSGPWPVTFTPNRWLPYTPRKGGKD